MDVLENATLDVSSPTTGKLFAYLAKQKMNATSRRGRRAFENPVSFCSLQVELERSKINRTDTCGVKFMLRILNGSITEWATIEMRHKRSPGGNTARRQTLDGHYVCPGKRKAARMC